MPYPTYQDPMRAAVIDELDIMGRPRKTKLGAMTRPGFAGGEADPSMPPGGAPAPPPPPMSKPMTPPPASPSSAYWNNTGFSGGRSLPNPAGGPDIAPGPIPKLDPTTGTYTDGSTPGGDPKPGGGATPPSGPVSGATGSNARSQGSFDFGRPQDPANSTKDLYAALVERAPDPGAAALDKSPGGALEQWFRQHIMPAMNAAGRTVHEVIGDRIFVSTRENPGGEWVDYMVAAGSPDWKFAWQSEAGGAGADAGPMVAAGGGGLGGGGMTSPWGPRTGGDPLGAFAGGQSSRVIEDILAALNEQVMGTQNPAMRDAIMKLLPDVKRNL